MFSVGCERTSTADPYFTRDYEQKLTGYETGKRVANPYCGRNSLLNPTYIFKSMMRNPDLSAAREYMSDYYPLVSKITGNFFHPYELGSCK